MDSWLASFISNHHWKWIYNLPRWQQTKSLHQNQRVYCLIYRGRFLCWFERYSVSVLLRYYKHLRPLRKANKIFTTRGLFIRAMSHVKGAMSPHTHARANENKLEKVGPSFSSSVGDFGRVFLSV